ncbi:MAG: tetratricopeptide repeat protein [Cyclobacteriaceae bacterium]|nr:tetratricopeptide repeat protein [Cyclobacteriaceae bacterium]MDH4296705.1 tetratricopeptide repeat protein [Cyclobacteriaceae bacterium]
MFTDIVGYTAMMGRDEQYSLSLITKNRDLHKKWITRFNGQLLKEMGDGMLASFQSISDASYCAGAILSETKKVDGLNLKIGIHLGDVVVEGNEIYGDGVNVASRVQALAGSNEILVTDIVQRNLINKHGIRSTPIGLRDLKNVSESVALYSISFDSEIQFEKVVNGVPKKSRYSVWIFIAIVFSVGLIFVISKYFSETDQQQHQSSQIKSLAVLPFDNLTGNKDQDYLLLGMHDNLITVLSQIQSLDVISKTSTLSYQNRSEKNIQDIANELNVDAVIEASVLSVGDSVRINIQLIKAFPKETHLWAKIFDRPFKNILYLFDDVASTVANEIGMTLHNSQSSSALRQINSEAYKEFMNGKMYSENNPTPENLDKALSYFNRSIELDSLFAPPYAGISFVWASRLQLSISDGVEAIPKIYSYNQRALDLDPNYPEAQYHKAGFAFQRWDWKESEKAFLKALELNPNHSFAHAHYAHMLMFQRRWEEALSHAETALRLDPLSPHILGLVAIVYMHHGDVDKAYAISSSRDDVFAKPVLDEYYAFKNGDFDRSIKSLLTFFVNDTTIHEKVNSVYTKSGYSKAIEVVAREMERMNIHLAIVFYERAGLVDESIRLLEDYYNHHDPNLGYYFTEILQKLQADPRYIELGKKLKLR